MLMRKTLLAVSILVLLTATNTASAQYAQMDYGPFLSHTFTAQASVGKVAYRGVAVPFTLPGGTKAGCIFDTEMLRPMCAWTGGFVKLTGVVFDGKHGTNPGPDGTILWATKPTPGWAKDEIGRAHGLNSSHLGISYAVFCLKKKK